jgi:hypothetical protein
VILAASCLLRAVAASAQVAAAAPNDVPEEPPLGVPSMLTPGADGTFTYAGTGFDAVIGADGSLSMEDRYGRVHLLGAIFDLTALAEHWAGNDPYLSERRAFLEATRSFRDQLIQRSEQRNLRRKLWALRLRSALTIQERKARTFAMWDQMSEDEKGLEGRSLLEAFVRQFYVEGYAFSPAELQHLNAQRCSRARFAPYEVRTLR